MKALLMNRKKRFIIYLIACLIPVVNQILSNYIFALLLGAAQGSDMAIFWKSLWWSLGIVFISSALFIVSRMMRIGFIRDIILDVRNLAFAKIQNMRFETFAEQSKAVYMSHLINDINQFEENFFLKLINVVFRSGAYIVSIIILAFYDLPFALAIFICSILIFLMVRTLESKTTAMQEGISASNEQLTVEVSNTFDGMELLKLNGVENAFLNKSLHAMDRVERKKLNYNVFTESQRNLTRLLSSLIFVGILLYLLSRLNSGLTFTTMSFMIMLANGCIWPLEQIVPLFNELKASIAIFNKITASESELASTHQGDLPFNFKNQLSVKNLSFRYEERQIVNNVSFTLEKGKKYLLKGASGSGKSTLIKLLSQTLERYEGDISLDNTPIRNILQDDFNRHVAFIYQDVFLFEDSLLNNITLYKPTSLPAVQHAINLSGLSEFASDHASGLERAIGENGQDLSGGQRQRIAIARALVKDVDIIFSDEATSSLNPELGRQIEETLLNLPCTLIAVSHRYYPGLTEQYDAVLEFKNGKITQYSTDQYFSEVTIA